MVTERRHARLAPIVGAFVLGALVILLLITFSLKQILLSGRTYQVPVLFKRISALEVGAKVKVYGYDAGQVKKISYRSGDYPVEVLLQIRKDIKIYPDARVNIMTVGMIGDTIIEIAAGSAASGLPLTQGDELYGQSPFDFQDLVNYTPGLLDSVSRTLESVQRIVADERNLRAFEGILVNTDALTSEMLSLVRGNRGSVDKSLSNVENITSLLNQTVEELRGLSVSLNDRANLSLAKFDQSIDTLTSETMAISHDLRISLQDMRVTSNEMTATSSEVRSLIAENRADLREVMLALRNTLEETRRIVDRVDRGQGTIGRAVNDPEVWIQLEAALRRINDILGARTQAPVLTFDYNRPPAPSGSR